MSSWQLELRFSLPARDWVRVNFVPSALQKSLLSPSNYWGASRDPERFCHWYIGAPGLPGTALLAGCKILLLLASPLSVMEMRPSFCPALSFSRSWKSHSTTGQHVWDGQGYTPTWKGPRTTFPWRRHIPWLLSFSKALLPVGRTNNHFNSSDTVLYIPLQPLPKHQSHAIYHKPENSLNLAYFESNRAVPALRRTALPAALPLAQ